MVEVKEKDNPTGFEDYYAPDPDNLYMGKMETLT